ncbi:hypothetical protein [Acanthopleuribacter pedis]|uniref:Uncharacterized protein n=1 Tax=Acanthopleuribacter pedis TaxID=442870 RepID=A0A8J7QD37_9BACT|nr:hypothetical protein [Acanthopleuribacter pedis]MBO1322317.1 hypothetical protein [Acanthopleuribacter pedis]
MTVGAPPFLCDGSLPEGGATRTVSLRLVGDLEKDTFENDVWTAADQIVTLFVEAVGNQVFAPVDAGRASLVQVSKEWREEGKTWFYLFQVEGLAASAWLCLVGMLAQSHHALEPIKSLSFGTQGEGPAVLLPNLLQQPRSSAIRVAAEYPFTVDFSELDSDQCDILFTFQRGLDREDFITIREAIYTWCDIKLLGGYLPGHDERPGIPQEDMIAHIAPREIQLQIMMFDLYDWALHGLANVALAVHRKGFELESLILEA